MSAPARPSQSLLVYAYLGWMGYSFGLTSPIVGALIVCLKGLGLTGGTLLVAGLGLIYALDLLVAAGLAAWLLKRYAIPLSSLDLRASPSLLLLALGAAAVDLGQRCLLVPLTEAAFGFAPSAPEPATSTYLAARAAGLLVMAPLVEELFFRGVLYRVSRLYYSAAAAVLMSGFLFGRSHLLTMHSFGAIAVSGVIMAWSYEKSGTLLVSVLVHFLINAVVLAEQAWPELASALRSPLVAGALILTGLSACRAALGSWGAFGVSWSAPVSTPARRVDWRLWGALAVATAALIWWLRRLLDAWLFSAFG